MKNQTEKIKLLREFVSITADILHSEEFRAMKNYRHHVKGSLYAHSVKVAFLCFKHHRRFGLKTDVCELVRGALLHDYYLYDRHDKSSPHKLHWFRHPKKALKNAAKKYPGLTHLQRDMIKHHMFPLTPAPPTTAAGWIICFYDKIAAVSDRFGENRWEIAIRNFKKSEKELAFNIS